VRRAPPRKFGLVPPLPLAGAARSGCGLSRNARHTGQLLSRARGQRAESKQEKGLRKASVGLVGKYTACSKASRAHPAGLGIPSKLSIFPYLRPGGDKCRWARFVGNVLVQTIAQKTVWARNSSEMLRFGQDFDPCPNFGLKERPGGERFVVSKPNF
jgi:hypothetical protein